jgi:nitroimidazol reductase NimA-like FMN-containing flavoprotein (pyridoxamine 5'-phosphate oxidase superfamily)
MKTHEHWFKSHLREISLQECYELLDGQEVGRVGFTDEAGPVVLPVNYTLDGAAVLIVTSLSSSLARHLPGKLVAFEVDDVDPYTESGWSVLVRGSAELVHHSEMPTSDQRPRPWVEGPRPLVIRISPHEVTGRWVLPA